MDKYTAGQPTRKLRLALAGVGCTEAPVLSRGSTRSQTADRVAAAAPLDARHVETQLSAAAAAPPDTKRRQRRTAAAAPPDTGDQRKAVAAEATESALTQHTGSCGGCS
jgi:hypothetical protein